MIVSAIYASDWRKWLLASSLEGSFESPWVYLTKSYDCFDTYKPQILADYTLRLNWGLSLDKTATQVSSIPSLRKNAKLYYEDAINPRCSEDCNKNTFSVIKHKYWQAFLAFKARRELTRPSRPKFLSLSGRYQWMKSLKWLILY